MADLAYVGDARGYDSGGSGTTIATASRSFTTGNHILVWVTWYGSNPSSITVTDTAGNTYTGLAKQFITDQGGQWFYCVNATGHASNVVTATFASAQSYKHIQAVELSGNASTVTQSVTQGSSTYLDTRNDKYLFGGGGSIVVAGISAYNSVASNTITGPDTFTLLTQAGTYARVGYAARATFTHDIYALTNASTTRGILACVSVNSGAAEPAPGVLAFVGAGTFPSDSLAATGTVKTLPARKFTTGNHAFAFFRWETTDPSSITVSDSAGNTYTGLPKQHQSNVGAGWFYVKNMTGADNNVITITFSESESYCTGFVIELSGTAGAVSQVAVKGGSVTSLDTSTGGYLSSAANSMMLAGLVGYSGMSGAVFGGSHTTTNLTPPTYNNNPSQVYARAAYAAVASSTTGGYVTASSFSATNAILAGVMVDSASAASTVNSRFFQLF